MTITIRSFPRRVAQFPRDDIEAKATRIAARLALIKSKPLAPAEFIGVWSGYGVIADQEFFNLTKDISPDLLKGSTVGRATLEKAGYFVPAILPARINQVFPERSYGSFSDNA